MIFLPYFSSKLQTVSTQIPFCLIPLIVALRALIILVASEWSPSLYSGQEENSGAPCCMHACMLSLATHSVVSANLKCIGTS